MVRRTKFPLPVTEIFYWDEAEKIHKPLAINGALTMAIGGSNLFTGQLATVPTAGTAVRLANIACREVTVIARKGNTGSIFIGHNSSVSSTNFGVELMANESFTFPINNPQLLYITSSVNGEGVSYVTI